MPKLQHTISEFLDLSRTLPVVGPRDTVDIAIAEMRERKADCVVVLQDGALVGIFTERDFLNRVAAKNLEPKATPVAEVMTRDVETLTPEDIVSYAINKMAVGGFRNVPIVDGDEVVAVLGIRDVIGHLFDLLFAVAERESTEVTPWTDIGGG